MKKFLRNKGITLVALVVTIVVLIILAGITISIVLGDNGILNKANGAKEQYGEAAVKEKVELALGDYSIEKNTGNNKDFPTFIRQSFQVGVSSNGDDTYSFNIDDWRVTTSEQKVVKIEKFTIEISKEYNSIAEMKEDSNIEDGKIVHTKGYWSETYGGAAYYDIVFTTSLSEDGYKCIKLDNGMHAILHAINDTISVNQFGAYGDGIHDDSNSIKLALNSGYSNIQFENFEYKINSRIDITKSNISLIGNNSTLFYNDEFTFVDDFIIGVFDTNGEVIKNVSLTGISLDDRNTTRNAEHLMLKVIKAEDIGVYKCNFKAQKVKGNTERRVTNMDVRSYWKNITIDGCNFENTTNGPGGGTIWIRAGSTGTGNLIMKNNNIKKSCHDETIAVFGSGEAHDLTFEKNTIIFDDTDVAIKSNPVMTFGLNSTNTGNVKFINNNVDIKADGGFMLFDKIDGAIVSGNTIHTTSLGDSSGSTYFVGTANSSNVTFDNNNMRLDDSNATASSEIFSNVKTITNNTIDTNTDFAIFIRNGYNVSNNTINLYKDLSNYSSVYAIRGTTLTGDVSIENNTFNFKTLLSRRTRLINMYKAKLNNYKVEITKNIVSGLEGQDSTTQNAIYFQSMTDTEEQTVYTRENNFGFYLNNYDWYDNSTNYNVVEK